MSAPRVMCYVQHLMGSGHQWRSAAIGRALCELGLEVTYVSGGLPLPGLDVGGADFVQLPPARAADMRYKVLVDERGQAVDDDWKAKRAAALLDVFQRCRPGVLVIETFPFGRRLLRFELFPLLAAAHERRPRPYIVCSVRDILEQRPQPGRNEEIVDLVNRYFDRVLVHSDPEFVRFDATFPLADRIEPKLRYTGYVLARAPAPPVNGVGRGEVVVSAGGGAFGEHVLRAALAARPLCGLAGVPWRILVGHNLAEDRFTGLRRQAGAGLVIERNRSDFPALLRNCAVSISQGGYNTMLEILDAGARAVVIPYADEREREQAVRARLLADRGSIEVIENSALTPRRLAQGIDAVSRLPARAPSAIDTNGAAKAAQLIAASAI
jgi:predicted glycosyltransferase